MRSPRLLARRPRGYRGPRRSLLRWAPLPLLAAGLASAREALAQPNASTPNASTPNASTPNASTPNAAAPNAAAPRAARAMARGESLAAADILATPGDTVAPHLVGWTTRRMIAAGEVLRTPAVAPPASIRAGDRVTVVYAQGGVALRLAGTAASDAALGTRVAVRVDTHRRFEGTVTAPGVVTLP